MIKIKEFFKYMLIIISLCSLVFFIYSIIVAENRLISGLILLACFSLDLMFDEFFDSDEDDFIDINNDGWN